MASEASSSYADKATPASVAAGAQQAAIHLRSALAIVESLLTESPTGPAESAGYPLEVASRGIHHALLALAECCGAPDPP